MSSKDVFGEMKVVEMVFYTILWQGCFQGSSRRFCRLRMDGRIDWIDEVFGVIQYAMLFTSPVSPDLYSLQE